MATVLCVINKMVCVRKFITKMERCLIPYQLLYMKLYTECLYYSTRSVSYTKVEITTSTPSRSLYYL
ncbi:hypothetical protein RIF29_17311 [Crotalaria pallida]|uniref:Uncharacterized protein n=1 Tax=Crotalaria pallida TaxID=3830 RepID=A0AAN9IKC6_CROPI